MIYYLFDDRAIDAHLKKLQGAIEAPSPPRRERRKQHLEKKVHYATCSRWDRHRAFGFITADVHLDGIGEDREVFCHRSSLPQGLDCLEPGQRVEFELVPSRAAGRPPQAKILRIVTEARAA